MRIIGFIFLLSAIAGCGGKNGNLVPENQSAIFPQEKASELISGVCYQPPSGITGYWTPQEHDLVGVEAGLEAYLEKIISNRKELPLPKRTWSDYYRQVTGVVRNDRKLLFISYYYASSPAERARREDDRKKESLRQGRPYEPDQWKRYPMGVDDGGSIFFRVLYDPQKKVFVWYEENGVG